MAWIAWSASEAVAGLPDAARAVVAGRAAAVRLLEVLDARAAVTDPAVPAGPFGVQVRGLRVTHPCAAVPALVDVDLDLPAGPRVALVGPSGAGKSTLNDVLLRFRDPTADRVLLGGIDVRHLAQADVRAAVSWCLQPPYLIATTLLDNLRLARPDASDDEVAAAADAAGLIGWVEELPRGWQTLVGEAGRWSSADRRSDSHRPGPAAVAPGAAAGRADLRPGLVVLDHGRVLQRGTAEQLRAQPWLSRRMWNAERAGDSLSIVVVQAGGRHLVPTPQRDTGILLKGQQAAADRRSPLASGRTCCAVTGDGPRQSTGAVGASRR